MKVATGPVSVVVGTLVHPSQIARASVVAGRPAMYAAGVFIPSPEGGRSVFVDLLAATMDTSKDPHHERVLNIEVVRKRGTKDLVEAERRNPDP